MLGRPIPANSAEFHKFQVRGRIWILISTQRRVLERVENQPVGTVVAFRAEGGIPPRVQRAAVRHA